MNDCFICNKHTGNIETSGVWGQSEVYDSEVAPMDGNNEVIELCNRLKTYIGNNRYE